MKLIYKSILLRSITYEPLLLFKITEQIIHCFSISLSLVRFFARLPEILCFCGEIVGAGFTLNPTGVHDVMLRTSGWIRVAQSNDLCCVCRLFANTKMTFAI